MERTTRSIGKNTIQIDRLSALPDDVVCHILSFLPTKLSVATSILATRWRLLWTHVPNLEFVSRYGYDSHSELKIRNDRFTDIVNSAMLLYKAGNMNTFRLFHIVGKGCTKSQLETWITAAIAHNVKKLHLSLIGRAILPSCIFTCETLVDLRLRFGGEIPMTGTVYLPALKSLHLDSINYESDEALPHLLSVCPLLEELTIIDSIELFKARYITSPTIKRLVLKADFYGRGQRGACNMKIDTPALTYLRLDGFVPADISEETLASLIQVEIVFDECTLLGEAHLYCHSVLQFVGRAKCLKLSSNGLRKLPESAFSDLAIKFGNLTKLELATVWCPLTYFLENADKLEVLIINEPLLSWSDKNQKTWMEPVEQCPACLYSLRTITFDNFRCEERQFKIVGYLAKNAKVLKKIEIHFCPYLICLKRRFDAVKRISMFELGSKACQLVFN